MCQQRQKPKTLTQWQKWTDMGWVRIWPFWWYELQIFFDCGVFWNTLNWANLEPHRVSNPLKMHGQTSEPINFSLHLFWSVPGASDSTAIQCAAQLSPILGFWSLEKIWAKYFGTCQLPSAHTPSCFCFCKSKNSDSNIYNLSWTFSLKPIITCTRKCPR